MRKSISGFLAAISLSLFVSLWIAQAQDTPAAPSSASSAAQQTPAASPPASSTQETPAPTSAPSPPTQHLTVDDVIKLSQAGLSEDVIIAKIKKNGQAFDLSPDQLLQLKGAKVTDRVIQYMLDPTKTEPAAAASGKSGTDPWPDEAGVYFRKTGETTWNELMPEVVNWKSGGFGKSLLTYGVVKQDVNGHLEGKTAKTQATTATEFLIVAPEGVAITEYQLLHLRQNSDNREFRSKTGGVFHSSGGAERDLLDLENKKVAPRRYLISIVKLKKGEYGILPPGAIASTNAAGSTGKIYSFSVAE